MVSHMELPWENLAPRMTKVTIIYTGKLEVKWNMVVAYEGWPMNKISISVHMAWHSLIYMDLGAGIC